MNKISKRRPSKAARRRAARRGTQTLLFNRGKGDQVVNLIELKSFENVVANTGTSGAYLAAQQTVKPYNIITTGAYAGLAQVYEQIRINSYTVRAWISNVSTATSGSTAFKLFGDVRDTFTNPYYEGLVQERNHKDGRAWTCFQDSWRPIEPSDYEFSYLTTAIDNGRYGQFNLAAIGLPTGNYSVVWEIRMQVEFKSLKNPGIPTVSTAPPQSPAGATGSNSGEVPPSYGWTLFGK